MEARWQGVSEAWAVATQVGAGPGEGSWYAVLRILDSLVLGLARLVLLPLLRADFDATGEGFGAGVG